MKNITMTFNIKLVFFVSFDVFTKFLILIYQLSSLEEKSQAMQQFSSNLRFHRRVYRIL